MQFLQDSSASSWKGQQGKQPLMLQDGTSTPRQYLSTPAAAAALALTAAAGAGSTAAAGAAVGSQLFTFGNELPPNFLLLGSDSPRSEASAGGLDSPAHSTHPSQARQQQHTPEQQGRTQQQDHSAGQDTGTGQDPATAATLATLRAGTGAAVLRLQDPDAAAALASAAAVAGIADAAADAESMPGPAAFALAAAAAGGACTVSAQDAPVFQFSTQACTPQQQQTSPCMQSFLPMLQQQQQGAASCDERGVLQGVQLALEGSELQADGVPDLPQAAAAVAAVSSDTAAVTVPEAHKDAAVPAAHAASAGTGSAVSQQQQQQQVLLVPETQCQWDGILPVQPPGRTPDSLAHYVSKQRRRRAAQAPAAAHAATGDQVQQQQQDGVAPVGGAEWAGFGTGTAAEASAGAWPPSWLQHDAVDDTAVGASQQQQQQVQALGDTLVSTAAPSSGAAAVAVHAANATGADSKPQPAIGHHSSSSSAEGGDASGGESSGSPVLIRLRRRGVRGLPCSRADRALRQEASPHSTPPADLAELEDSDWDREGSPSCNGTTAAAAARSPVAAAATAAAGSSSGSGSSSSDDADVTELEDSEGCELPGFGTLAQLDAESDPLARSDIGSDAGTDVGSDVGSDAIAADPLAEGEGCGASGSNPEQPDGCGSFTHDDDDDDDGAASDTASSSAGGVGSVHSDSAGGHCEDRRLPAAAAGKSGAAAAALAAAFAQVGSKQQLQQWALQGTPAVGSSSSGRQQGGSYMSPLSCSGSSLPSGCRPYSAAAAAAAAAATSEGGAVYYSAAGAKASTAGNSASSLRSAAAAAAAGSAAASMLSGQQGCGEGGVCEEEGDGDGSQLPVMRLNFSLGGCSSGTGWDYTPTQQQQQQQQGQEGEALEEGDTWSGVTQDSTQCSAGGEEGEDAASDWRPQHSPAAASSSTSSGSRSTSSTSSSSRLRLEQRSSGADGTAATAAALMQKRKILKQQQQQEGRTPAFVTPPSDCSLFVTRRKCPRPAASGVTAAAAAGGGDAKCAQGAGSDTAAAHAAVADGDVTDSEEEQEEEGPAACSAAADADAAGRCYIHLGVLWRAAACTHACHPQQRRVSGPPQQCSAGPSADGKQTLMCASVVSLPLSLLLPPSLLPPAPLLLPLLQVTPLTLWHQRMRKRGTSDGPAMQQRHEWCHGCCGFPSMFCLCCCRYRCCR